MERLFSRLHMHWDDEPNRIPLNRPSGAFSPTYVFSVVALKPNGARRSRRFRVAQTRIHRGYAEAQEIADGEAA